MLYPREVPGGWDRCDLGGRDYDVRQLRDMKIIPFTELIAPRLLEFATACGETHAMLLSLR
jgi:hypothetical protein